MMTRSGSRVQFGGFEADLTTGELFRGGKKISIQHKPFQILTLLLHNPGQLVSRERIFDTLWPDVFVKRELSLNTAMHRLRVVLEDTEERAGLVETVGSRGYRLKVAVRFPSAEAGRPHAHLPRLAVAPFISLNGDAEEYFSNGLTEQLIAQLGQSCKHLTVIAPVSSAYFEKPDNHLPQLATELGTNYLLSGTVLRNSHRLRITAKLIRMADESCLWAESYLRENADIFSVQEEIAQNIARAMHEALPVAKRPDMHMSTTAATYEKYLKACYFANKFLGGFENALRLFEEVVAEDPAFAPAHGALAMMFVTLSQSGILRPDIVYDRIRSEAAKALALCEHTAEPHTALGFAQLYYDADGTAAESSFRRALQINPSFAMAYVGYSQMLAVSGRMDEALSAAKRAREIDPLSPIVNTMLACTFYIAGQFEEALKWISSAIEIEPAFSIAHCTLGWIHEVMANPHPALDSYRASVRHSTDSLVMLANLARGAAVAGDLGEANRLLSKVLRLRDNCYVSGYWIALIYAGLGQQEDALIWLEKAVKERCGWRIYVGLEPRLRVLSANLKFQRLLQEIGLPNRREKTAARLGTKAQFASA